MTRRKISTYAAAHLVAANTGVGMFRAAAARYRGTQLGEELAELATAVGEDRARLEGILRRLGVDPGLPPLRVAGQALESAGHTSRVLHLWMGLPDVAQLEALRNAVSAKAAGWDVMLAACDSHRELDAEELQGLLVRAHEQADRLRLLHIQMARERLGGDV
jgi:hypothetical protein